MLARYQIGPLRAYLDTTNEFIKIHHISVGGQSFYEEGPSVLLSIYSDPIDALEIQLPLAQVDELIGYLQEAKAWVPGPQEQQDTP